VSTWCCEFELSDGRFSSVSPRGAHDSARVLVRLHGEPLGYLTVPMASAVPDSVSATAMATFADRIAAHLAAEGVPEVSAATDACPNGVVADDLVSVVVCTRNRADQLGACLDRLRGLTYPHLEILVVDNAPTDDSTRDVVAAVAAADPRFRYVAEPRPGLSRARNTGLTEARGRYLAYTDDDVAVDAGWVEGLLKGFGTAADVGCVTGLVATAEIAGAAEQYFDARAASWSTRCEPQRFDLDGSAPDDALYPYSPGIFGTGANLAFDRAFLVELGGFDEALGAGTRTRGGEDLDIFVRVLRAGRALVYEPAALVWHHHRADREALLNQMFGYGTGLAAFVTKCLLQRDTRREVLGRLPLGLRRLAGIRTQTRERLTEAVEAPRGAAVEAPRGAAVEAPRGAMLREFLGFGAGPVLYLRARRAVRVEARGTR
jgi:GT2 family glycosyltransferase